MKLGISDFFSDVANFFKSGSVLGIDIGTVSVKIAELSEKRGKLKLENYAILETKNYLSFPNQVIHTSALKIVEKDAIELLKIVLREMKPKTKLVLASLPSFAVFMTTLDLPLLSKEETAKVIGFQASQYIPLPINQVSIDWFKIEEFQNARGERGQRILLIGIPNEIIKKYRYIFSALGLKLMSLEVESMALVRSLAFEEEAVTLIIDIGAESTNVAVSEKGILKYNGETDYGGVYLTQALSRGLGVSVYRAEELKRRKGLLATGGEFELSTLILPFLDVILREIRYVKDTYERRFGKKVSRLVFIGGGAKLMGIEKYFSEQLNLPVASPATLAGIVRPVELEPMVKELDKNLAVAVGLARKYFSPNK